MPGVATVISRFSLGIVLTALPILLAHFYGKDSAKTVALAINLSSYSSWLALGGYATVMRDFRLAENAFEKYRLSQIYRRLAFLQSVGALLLTVVIAGVYVKLAQPVYLSNSIDLLLIGLMFGVVIQCSSFWLNISLGISYSENRFIGLGIGPAAGSAQRAAVQLGQRAQPCRSTWVKGLAPGAPAPVVVGEAGRVHA